MNLPPIPAGLILLDKPEGVTSFSAIGSVKKKLETGKVGHTGTLDKFASGLLLVLSGKLTRLCPFFTALDKEYEAEFVFGRETDTLDPEGSVVKETAVPERSEIERVLPLFTGEISQVPPLYSAVHVGGERASRLARKGRTAELSARKVRVYGMDVLGWEPPKLRVRISCSKGTYVRSLARDLGEAAGSCAYVDRLRRTRVGGFHAADAVSGEDFDPMVHVRGIGDFLPALPGVIRIDLRDEQAAELILRGTPLRAGMFARPPAEEGIYAVFGKDDRFLALIERKGEALRYLFSGGA